MAAFLIRSLRVLRDLCGYEERETAEVAEIAEDRSETLPSGACAAPPALEVSKR
jgi:hypothetical protein